MQKLITNLWAATAANMKYTPVDKYLLKTIFSKVSLMNIPDDDFSSPTANPSKSSLLKNVIQLQERGMKNS